MEPLGTNLEAPPTHEERTAAAQAAVRSYCGWHVAPILTTTVDKYEISDALLVPTMRLVRIVAIETFDGRNLLTEEGARVWGEVSGIIHRRGGWRGLEEPLKIDIEHGYASAEVPDVIDIVKQVAARASGPGANTPDTEQAGPFRRTWGATSPRLGVSLLDIEKAKLSPYVVNWAP